MNLHVTPDCAEADADDDAGCGPRLRIAAMVIVSLFCVNGKTDALSWDRSTTSEFDALVLSALPRAFPGRSGGSMRPSCVSGFPTPGVALMMREREASKEPEAEAEAEASSSVEESLSSLLLRDATMASHFA